MVQKLGKWYIINSSENNIFYKIHERYIIDGKFEMHKYGEIYHININNIWIIGDYGPDPIYLGCYSVSLNCGTRSGYRSNNIVKINLNDYEDMLETEKLRQQVEKLSAHVLALMICNGSLSEKYDGEFP